VLADGRDDVDTIFVGPCCESGDILTPAPGDSEPLGPAADHALLSVTWSSWEAPAPTCAALSTVNYDSYPQAPEVMREPGGALRRFRRREALDEIWCNEV
jgi:diaminopimelate decarboxylase